MKEEEDREEHGGSLGFHVLVPKLMGNESGFRAFIVEFGFRDELEF